MKSPCPNNKAFTKSPIVFSSDFQRTFIVYVDASSYAKGACITRKNQNQHESPTAFISKKLSLCQECYATIEKVACTIIIALKKFDHNIYRIQVTE